MQTEQKSSVSEQDIEKRVLKVFASCRKDANAPFDVAHFMDFLVSPPAEKFQIRNSFRGAKKHGNFLRKIELEFGICFTLSDYDTMFSLAEFVQKISERIAKKKGNIAIIKERMQEKDYFIFEIVMLLILGVLYYFFGLHWLVILVSFPILFAVYWVFSHRISNKKHTQALSKIILKK